MKSGISLVLRLVYRIYITRTGVTTHPDPRPVPSLHATLVALMLAVNRAVTRQHVYVMQEGPGLGCGFDPRNWHLISVPLTVTAVGLIRIRNCEYPSVIYTRNAHGGRQFRPRYDPRAPWGAGYGPLSQPDASALPSPLRRPCAAAPALPLPPQKSVS